MSEGNPQLTIRAQGGSDELLALLDWFGHDDALRGRVRPVQAPAAAGQMPGALITALAIAVGAGGVGPALVKSLTTWLTHRRSAVKLTLTRSDGTSVDIDAARVDAHEVLQDLRDLLAPPPGDQ